MRIFQIAMGLSFCVWATTAPAEPAPASFAVKTVEITDEKAVFATVESAHVVTARSRTGGTITSLSVQDGDTVTAGQVIAIVADPKLVQQRRALEADIAGQKAQLAQAKIDFARAQGLIHSGAISRSVFDQSQTAVSMAFSTLASKTAARDALNQQIAEGTVLAPVSGRVLLTPVTQGAVVLNGDTVASIAQQDYVLRLDIPEYHMVSLHVGDPVRIDVNMDAHDDKIMAPVFGKITLIYPQIQNGRLEADASAPALGSYFVGQRVEVWVNAGVRPGIVIPSRYIQTRFGLDYVDLQSADGNAIAVPVQQGNLQPTLAMPDGMEILSGLHAGDTLLLPSETTS